MLIEEGHDVLRDLREVRVDWLGTHLHEHVGHVLDQDQLGLISHRGELIVKLD